MINHTRAIAILQAQWHSLQDLDRADAVLTIQQSGISLRGLAKLLNCSDWLLRHLLRAREASPEDLALARAGQISTNELARRSLAIRSGRISMHGEAFQFEITKTAIVGCETIRNWLAEQSLGNSYGVQVAREARRVLADAEMAGKLPSGKAPSGFTTDEIIRKCRTPEPTTQNAEVISWYSRWLAIWTCFVIPNARAREQALDLAIKITC
jgi:hypothetical protein